MKIRFKNQKLQADAAAAAVDVFAGQPPVASNYLVDQGVEADDQMSFGDYLGATG